MDHDNGVVECKSLDVVSQESKLLPQLPVAQPIDISFKDVDYSVSVSMFSREKKKVLSGVNGLFRSGELSAIMGPSGAGKSSLLNVLSGFVEKGCGGSIYLNGAQTKRSRIKQYSAYIMHEDNLNPYFTVYESMKYAADMKLGNKSSRKAKQMLINKILNSMSMMDTKNTLCSRLSGGERKRLNVCMELIDNPPILFLDEPTSGLDSSNCRLLVSELKDLAKTGRTVICTIHQPSAAIFSMFDHLYLINDGKVMYQGDTSNLLPFLNTVGLPCPIFHNPADFVMDVVSGEFGSYSDKLISASSLQSWRDHAPIEDVKINQGSGKDLKLNNNNGLIKRESPSEFTRYGYLVEHVYKQLHRDWLMTYVKVALHALSALSIGILFYNFGFQSSKVFSNTIYMFLTSVYISYTNVMPATVKFPSQLLILKREHFNNWYKFRTYFFAFMTVNIPLQLLFAAVFIVISYIMTNQPVEWFRICFFALSSMFEIIITDMLGMMMGTSRISVNGIFAANIVLLLITLLGGYFVPLRDLSGILHFLSYFSFLRYSFELKVTAIYGMGRERMDCPMSVLYCHVRDPKVIMKLIGLEDNQSTRDMIVLVIYTAVIICMTYFRLRHCLKKCQ